MRRLLSLALTLATAVAGAQTHTIREICRMTREEAASSASCEIFGAVGCVFDWQENSFVIVDPDEPDGPGLYVSGTRYAGGNRFAGASAALLGADRLEVGDLVRVVGLVSPLMLEPGVIAVEISVSGHVDLPTPAERSLGELATGRFDNRRVSVRGVLRNVRAFSLAKGPVTMIYLGTSEGLLRAHVRGEWPDLALYRNADVIISGVASPSYNARAEFLRPELEVLSREGIRILQTHAPTDGMASQPGAAMGVKAWSPEGDDGHLRRLAGEVLYVDARAGFFVMQAGTSVRVNVDGPELPEVGDMVEAVGFPSMSDDCGVLESGEFAVVGRADIPHTPFVLSESDIDEIFTSGDPALFDCHYRLVTVGGRIVSADRMPDGASEIVLLVGGHRLPVRLADAPPGFVEAFADRPLATATGVMKVRYDDNPNTGRGISVGDLSLFLRAPADLVVSFDADARNRRLLRHARTAGLVSLVPLALLVCWLGVRTIRQRERAAAVAADRRRLAEELHDTIAQHLSGARLLLYSVQAEAAALSGEARDALGMTGDILESARREVRDAVMNLKSDALSTLPLEALLRKVAERTNVKGDVRVRTKLRGLPSNMPSQMKTDLLAIVQEAVTNAIKHGGARTIAIVSDPVGRRGFSLAVLNDGVKFDSATAVGPEAGHFGLSGMRERARRNGVVLSFGVRDDWTEVRMERGNG